MLSSINTGNSITLYPILNYMQGIFKIRNWTFTSILLLVICHSSPVYSKVVLDSTKDRQLFLNVYRDLKQGIYTSYRLHKKKLMNYHLFPYLQYEVMRKRIHNVRLNELNNFTAKHHDSPLAWKIRNQWLHGKAKNKQWKDFLNGYQPTSDIELRCHHINARLNVTPETENFDNVHQLWLSGESRPKACDPVFAAWKKSGKRLPKHIWQRIKLAIDNNNPKLARYLARDLTPKESKMVELWIRVNDNPKIINKPHLFRSANPKYSEIIIHGIKKVARTSPKDAILLWKKLAVKHSFNERHYSQIIRAIAISLANKHHNEAEKWLNKVPMSEQDEILQNARLKVALRNENWSQIIKLYEHLSAADKHEEKWQYWYARALEMHNEKGKSQKILSNLSQIRSYYGFLASTKVTKPYSFKNRQANLHPDDSIRLLNMPAVNRARELFFINEVHLGNSEWLGVLGKLNDHERQVAAKLANDWNSPNWAILALAKAKNKDNLNLRFPKSYSKYILQQARNNRLDPAFIFAIARQESAFVPTARSSAGALGLMQVMPSTAKMIARKNQIKLNSHRELLNAHKNITIGCKYIREMLDINHKNPAIAAAAYNAGPNRVAKWLPDHDLPVDVWIETIPFSETRNYVQNVLTYTVIYQKLLGQKPNLNKNMPLIAGKISSNPNKTG